VSKDIQSCFSYLCWYSALIFVHNQEAKSCKFIVKKIICLLVLVAVWSCVPEYETKYYLGVSRFSKDTGLLKLVLSEEAFYGDYQINYDDKSLDKGSVKGNVSGDTLLGKFSFLSRNNVRTVAPVAFLKSSEGLKSGVGTAGTYMGFHVFLRGSIIFGDSLLQFQPISKQEMDALKGGI
jgi:hypothetical protein